MWGQHPVGLAWPCVNCDFCLQSQEAVTSFGDLANIKVRRGLRTQMEPER